LLAHFEKLTKRPTSPADGKLFKSKLTKVLNQEYKKGDYKQLEKLIANYEKAVENANAVSEVDFGYQCTTVGVMIEAVIREKI